MRGSVSCVVSGFLLLLAARGQSRQAVLVAHIGDRLEVLDGAAKHLRTLASRYVGYDAFSVDRAASVAIAVRGNCGAGGGGDLYFIPGDRSPKKMVWRKHFLSEPFGTGEIEVYADPAISPSGKSIAFVARPCNTKRRLDLVESSGFVVLLDRVTGRSRVLSGSKSSVGAPIGFANNPTWSPDEKSLYVNFETGFRILSAAGGTVSAEYPGRTNADNWSNAVGWIGSRCVVFAEGKDFKQADENPPMVLNIFNGETKGLDVVLGPHNGRLSGISSLQWPYILTRQNGQLNLLRAERDSFVANALSAVQAVALVAGDPNSWLPQFCRP